MTNSTNRAQWLTQPKTRPRSHSDPGPAERQTSAIAAPKAALLPCTCCRNRFFGPGNCRLFNHWGSTIDTGKYYMCWEPPIWMHLVNLMFINPLYKWYILWEDSWEIQPSIKSSLYQVLKIEEKTLNPPSRGIHLLFLFPIKKSSLTEVNPPFSATSLWIGGLFTAINQQYRGKFGAVTFFGTPGPSWITSDRARSDWRASTPLLQDKKNRIPINIHQRIIKCSNSP